jgi:hypothetical protein
MSGAVRDALRGMHRFLKEATGEAKWDDYLAECLTAGREPMSRRQFELRRAHQRECSSQMRCC